MHWILRVLSESWRLLQDMAPSLWLGFLASGLLAVLLPRAWVKRHLSRPGVGSILKASILGSPMPLCSCGVVPVAAELSKLGASPGAVAAFLVSTPQTGVENILVCLALLGPVFAIASPLVAVASGLLVGLLVQAVEGRKAKPEAPVAPPAGASAGSRGQLFFRTAFRSLPGDLAVPLLAGLLVSGAISASVPPDAFKEWGGDGWTAKFVILAISIPMYVCSAASIPVAASFLAAGLSPGAALVFLMAGPATNGANIAALFSLLGRRAAVAFLLGLTGCILVFARLLDLVAARTGAVESPAHHHADPQFWHPLVAVALVGMLLAAKLPDYRRTAR